MQEKNEKSDFDLFQFQMKMREARGEGIPVQPPTRPVFETPHALNLLSYLQSCLGKTVYGSLIKEEDEDKKRRWNPPPLFYHDL